jgi:phage-related protein
VAENAGKLEIEVIANLAGFAKELKPRVDAIAEKVKAKIAVLPDPTGLRRKLRQVLDEAQAGEKLKVGVEAAAAGLRRQVTEAVTVAAEGQKVEIGTDLDAKDLPVKARVAKEEAKKAAGSIKIPVKFDVERGIKSLVGGISALKIPALITLIGPLIGLVSSLSAGIVALGGAIGPVVGLAGALPGVILAGAQAFAATKIAVGGLADALKEVSKAEAVLQRGGKLTADQQAKLKQALDGLSPSARRFVVEVTRLRPALDRLRASVQESFFSRFIGQVDDLARRALPVVQRALTSTGAVLGTFVSKLAAQFSPSGGLLSDLNAIAQTNAVVLGHLSETALFLIRAFVNVAVAARPLVVQLSIVVERTAAAVTQFTNARRSSGEMARFFAKAADVGGQLARILGNIAIGLLGVFRGGAPLGNQLLDSIEKLTQRFADFTRSLAGRNALRKWFNDARPAITESTRLVGALASGIAGLSTQSTLAPLLAQIRQQLGPALSALLSSLNSALGPSLVNAATALANLLTALAGAGGGGLTAFVDTLTRVINALTALITSSPLATKATRELLVVFGTAKALSGVASIIGGIGKSIFEFGEGAVAATKGATQFVRGLAGAEGAAGGAAKAGLLLRSGFLGVGQALAFTGSKLLSFGSAVVTALARINVVTIVTKAWTAAQWLLNVAMDANPIGLVIVAVAALITAFVLAYQHSARFRAIVLATWNAIKIGVAVAVRFLRPLIIAEFTIIATYIRIWVTVIRTLINAGIVVFQAIGRALGPVAAVFAAVFRLIVDIVRLAFAVLKLIVFAALFAIETVIRVQLEITKAVFSAVWNAITAVVGAAVRFIVSVVRFGFAAVSAAVSTAIGIVRGVVSAGLGFVRGIVSGVVGAIRATWNAFWGSALGAAVRNGISAAINAVGRILSIGKTAADAAARFVKALGEGIGRAVADVASKVGQIVGKVLGIGEDLYNAGAHIIQRLIDGMDHMVKGVIDKIGSITKAIRDHLPFSPAKVGPLSGQGSPEIAGAKISKMLADGIASQRYRVAAAVTGIAATIAAPPFPAATLGIGRFAGASGPATTVAAPAIGGNTINVYPQPGQSEVEIAAAVARRLGAKVGR